jgi:lysozyme family protein
MSSTASQLRREWSAFECKPKELRQIPFGPDEILIAPPAAPAWRALASVFMAHRYNLQAPDCYSYCCRAITGGAQKSLHCYGIAIDVNASTNPYRKTPDGRAVRFSNGASQADRARDVRLGLADTDMTPELIADARAIRTAEGKTVFNWGGDWRSLKDAMHFEIALTPAQLECGVDWTTVRGADGSAPACSVWGERDCAAEPEIACVRGERGSFEKCCPVVEKWEGHFVNDPDDPGGPTSMGITQGDLARWRGRPVSVAEVRDLTRDEARRIFRQFYWKRINGDQLPLAVAQMCYDGAVLRGVYEAGRELQTALNLQGCNVRVDGIIGPEVIAACDSADCERLVSDFASIAEAYLRDRPGFPKYGKGWLSRLTDVRSTAMRMAAAPAADEAGEREKIAAAPARQQNAANGVDATSFDATGPQIKSAQKALLALGYAAGPVDGVFGRRTRSAVRAFQADNGLPGAGNIDARTWAALSASRPCPQSPDQPSVTAGQLRSKSSQTIRNADRSRLTALISGVLGALGIFNSAFVQFANSRIPDIHAAPDRISGLLANISSLLTQHQKSIDIGQIRALFQNLSGGTIPKDVIPLLDQIRQSIPKETLLQDPVLASLVKNYDVMRRAGTPLRTVFDAFITGDAGGLQSLCEALAAITGNLLPGFSGSAVALLLALFIRHFGGQIIKVRLQEHAAGQNLKT